MTVNLIICGIMLVVGIAFVHKSYHAYALITGIWIVAISLLTFNGYEFVCYIALFGYPITMALYLAGSALSLLTDTASQFMDSH